MTYIVFTILNYSVPHFYGHAVDLEKEKNRRKLIRRKSNYKFAYKIQN